MNLTPVKKTFGNEDQSWMGSAHGSNSARSITLDISKFTSGTHYPNGYLPSGLPLAKIASSGKYGPYTDSVNEVQTLTLSGSPTGGTFKLTFNGDETAAIAKAAVGADVQAALVALASVGAGNVTVSGSASGPWTVTFVNDLGGFNQPMLVLSTNGLTGGSTPSVTIAEQTAGGAEGDQTGLGVGVGFLFTTVEVLQRDGSTPTAIVAALLDHGRVIESKLPIAVDEGFKADVGTRLIFI